MLCDWCFEPLPKQDSTGESWKQHVNKDYEPYICLSEKCTEPPRFASSTLWFEHMTKDHGKNWYRQIHLPLFFVCPLSNDYDTAFTQTSRLEDHIRDQHAEIFPEPQIHTIVRQSQLRRPRPRDICLLCCLSMGLQQDPAPWRVLLKNHRPEPLASMVASYTREGEHENITTEEDSAVDENDDMPSYGERSDRLSGDSMDWENIPYGDRTFLDEDPVLQDLLRLRIPPSNLSLPYRTQIPICSKKTEKQGDGDLGFSEGRSESGDTESIRRQVRSRHRHAIKQIIDSETIFVKEMQFFHGIFEATMDATRSGAPGPNPDKGLIFRNISEIADFHSSFLVQLKEAANAVDITMQSGSNDADWKYPSLSIGPVFTKNVDEMQRVHLEYHMKSDEALERLDQIQEEPIIKSWLSICERSAAELIKPQSLRVLLRKPRLRLGECVGLLHSLIHSTLDDCPDYTALSEANDRFRWMVQEIHSYKNAKYSPIVSRIMNKQRGSPMLRTLKEGTDEFQQSHTQQVWERLPSEGGELKDMCRSFHNDYLSLQIILEDMKHYRDQARKHMDDFIRCLSSL
ncbi:Fc.00g058760.m01.CDS01 [Cosmosporella sp. VM-42]